MAAAFRLAQIFGPLLLIVGVWHLFYRHRAAEAAHGLASSPALLYMNSIISLIVGLTIVSMFNHWVWDLTLLVTLFGWFLILRGVLAIYWPEFLIRCQLGGEGCVTFWGIVFIVWGFFLTWLGFFCEMGRDALSYG